MQRDIARHRAPRRLDLAEAVVDVARVRVLEVDHLVGREVLTLRVVAPVLVTLDQFLAAQRVARNDAHPLAWHRPQFDGDIQRRVEHGMQVRIARQLHVQHAQDGRVEAVLVGIDLREKGEERMRVRDDLVVVAVLRRLRHRVARRELREVARQVRLRAATRPARVPCLRARRAVAHIEAKRLRGDSDRVQTRGGVHPRSVLDDRAVIVERRRHILATDQSRRACDLVPMRVVVRVRGLAEDGLDAVDDAHMTLIVIGGRERRECTASARAHTPSSCPAVASYETLLPEYR